MKKSISKKRARRGSRIKRRRVDSAVGSGLCLWSPPLALGVGPSTIHTGVGDSRELQLRDGTGPFTRPFLVHPGAPPARAKILSHARSSAERHPCAASVAHSPPPSSHVEAVGQLRDRDAARLQCQPPRDVVALLHLAPSPLPLRVRRPAPSNGSRLQSHATPQCCGAGLGRNQQP